MSTTSFTLPVRGMTCASCVAHVERASKNVDGVKDVNVNLATEKASVWFSTDAAGIKDLVEAVQETGYEIPTETVILPIGGMTVDEEKVAARSEYKGKIYYFCAPGCKVAFDKDPDKYVKGEGEHHGMHGMHH